MNAQLGQIPSQLVRSVVSNLKCLPMRAIMVIFTGRYQRTRAKSVVLIGSFAEAMAKKLTGDDTDEIGILLAKRYPEIQPFSLEPNELLRHLMSLNEFMANAEDLNGAKLEAVREAWCTEFLDRTQ